MGVAISELVSVSTVNDTDVMEIEQSGVSKKITALQIRNALNVILPTEVPLDGDVISYNGTQFTTSATPRWRVVPQVAYTPTPSTTSRFTFSGAVPSGGIKYKANEYFSVGDPVRAVIGGTTYYGYCLSVTDTLLVISGAILPLSAATSLAVGSRDMIKHVSMSFAGTGYNASSTLILTKGCQHMWSGPTGYLCGFSCAHMNTSATTVVNLQVNGGASNMTTSGVTVAAGASSAEYGPYVTLAEGQVVQAQAAISDGQRLTAKTPTVGAAADFLIIDAIFVVP